MLRGCFLIYCLCLRPLMMIKIIPVQGACSCNKELDQICTCLIGWQNFLGETFPQVFESRFNFQDWKSCHAVITSLSIIAKNCSMTLKDHLHLVAESTMKASEDGHVRVRWATIHATGDFCKHLSYEFQDQQHQKALPTLIKAMSDFHKRYIH